MKWSLTIIFLLLTYFSYAQGNTLKEKELNNSIERYFYTTVRGDDSSKIYFEKIQASKTNSNITSLIKSIDSTSLKYPQLFMPPKILNGVITKIKEVKQSLFSEKKYLFYGTLSEISLYLHYQHNDADGVYK